MDFDFERLFNSHVGNIEPPTTRSNSEVVSAKIWCRLGKRYELRSIRTTTMCASCPEKSFGKKFLSQTAFLFVFLTMQSPVVKRAFPLRYRRYKRKTRLKRGQLSCQVQPSPAQYCSKILCEFCVHSVPVYEAMYRRRMGNTIHLGLNSRISFKLQLKELFLIVFFQDMRSSYAQRTTSLDQRKMYRTKQENRAAKMATLGRVRCQLK